MANTKVRKTYSIVQGGGRVYVGPPSVPVHGQYFADEDALNAATTELGQASLLGDLTRSPLDDTGIGGGDSTSWTDAGYLDDQGVSLTIGNEVEVITEIESLWPIDARKVSAGAMFRAMLLEATLDNLYNLGLSKVGLDLFDSQDVPALAADGTVDNATSQPRDVFSGERFGGPNEHIPGVGIIFDGPAPASDPAGGDYLKARRVFLPRVINITPIDLVAAKRGQTMIRVDLTVLMPDHVVFRPCYIADQTVG